jgi:hypothetical protein
LIRLYLGQKSYLTYKSCEIYTEQVYNVSLNNLGGFWGRTPFSETEDGNVIIVTEFGFDFRSIGPLAIKWADMGEHPENSTVPVDLRLVRVLEKYNYGMDQRLVRHIAYGFDLPTEFPKYTPQAA